jgi:hypothetical protein
MPSLFRARHRAPEGYLTRRGSASAFAIFVSSRSLSGVVSIAILIDGARPIPPMALLIPGVLCTISPDGRSRWPARPYGRAQGVRITHYLISSGNAEIFAGTPIASKFAQVYASKFMFDENGVAAWPALAVNYTTKTQYLFRINKGAFGLSDNSKVNQFVEKRDRPVPFENMVFIGDGSTDIPCFRLVKEQGGLSVAVFKPHTKGARGKADNYIKDGRVHCAVPAVYTDGSELDRVIKANINAVATRAALSGLLAEGPQ